MNLIYPNFSLVKTLLDSKLQKKHWDSLFEDFNLEAPDPITLKDIAQSGIFTNLARAENVSSVAADENMALEQLNAFSTELREKRSAFLRMNQVMGFPSHRNAKAR